jgi:phage terminase Nu1 subunit (DNA packaging protein)
MDDKVSQSEFAKIIGCSRQYVSKLKSQGKIKFDRKGLVLVAASKKLLADSADPANDPATTMPRRDGRKRHSAGITAQESKQDAAGDEPISTTGHYQKSRAVKETYDAKLKKIEYEQKIGELVHREGVERASFKIGRVLQNKLSALPSRLAPRVTIESDQKINFQIIQDEIAIIIKDIENELQKERTKNKD